MVLMREVTGKNNEMTGYLWILAIVDGLNGFSLVVIVINLAEFDQIIEGLGLIAR